MLSNKRILILVRSMEISGGTQKLVAEISKQFEKKKYDVCINTLFYNKKDCYKKRVKKCQHCQNLLNSLGFDGSFTFFIIEIKK